MLRCSHSGADYRAVVIATSVTGWLAIFACGTTAGAQTLGAPWTFGTTVNVSGGAATDSDATRPFAGAALGWEVTPTIGVEGSAAWFDRGAGARAFGAALKGQAGVRLTQHVVPFAEGGVGLYRASFERGSEAAPDFYRARMTTSGPLVPQEHTFTDPAIVVGGGVNLFVSRHIALRPDVETMIVRHGGSSHTLTAFALRLAYHFEDHPVTPEAGPRLAGR
jgi:hypothetical protein